MLKRAYPRDPLMLQNFLGNSCMTRRFTMIHSNSSQSVSLDWKPNPIQHISHLDLEEGMSEMSGIVCYSQYIFLNKDLPGDAPGGCYNLAFTCVHTREVRHTSTFGSRHWSWGRTRRKILARICHVRIAGLIISIFSNDLHKSHPDTFGCRFVPRHVAQTRKAL